MNNEFNVIEIDISSITPYKNNPRNNEKAIDYVAESIKNFGFRVPIIIDKDNVIVAGHTRYKAAKQLEIKKVPCIVISDLTPEQIRAFRIADNKVSEYSTWNEEMLRKELLNLSDFELQSIGFQDWELDNLLNPLSDDDINDFFVDKEVTEKEPKLIKCPYCGEEFEQ
uniref:ParB protein n=1 Tax=Siphoviridae sp. ct0uL16 TaxID=2825299 RepID=A0A8S5Q5X1_9CAUD|nr:MAG TPA: ParB protein [Siphoviridae sp. ct0uL16]